jgi:S1-C subfamily serine protease
MLTAAVNTGDLLDLALIALAVVVGIRGYRQGLLVGAASLAGFIGGALIGTRIAGPIAGLVASGSAQSLVALLTVLVVATVLEELLAYVATIGRDAVRLGPLRVVDSVFGTILAVAAVLFVAWLETRDLPLVFAGLNPPFAPPVAPPVNGAVPARVIRAAAPSIVKIVATDPECGQQTEGSGFVYAPGHVLTNAHVVAGARGVHIVRDGTGAGLGLRARVVLFDPNTDVAVLDVPGLARTSLAFHSPVASGAPAEVIGYPENGPFTPTAARVAVQQLITGPNIYSDATVTRQVYVLRATVRPGNSGGPLLAPNGRVDGVVFAASTTDPATGYALTAHQVRADARAGASAVRPVSTQNCA